MAESEFKEGKIEFKAEIDGLFRVDVERLNAINLLDEIMIATRHNNFPVRAGDKLCGTRVIPLIIQDEKLRRAEALAGDTPILDLLPYKLKAAGVITTGSEVASGRIQDTFTPILAKKLQAYGITMTEHLTVGDGLEQAAAAIDEMRKTPVDKTPRAIARSGARIGTYGAAVRPGAVFLLGYYEDGQPVMGLPGCVMFAKATIFDLILPRVAAGLSVTKQEIAALGCGGLCLGCAECHYPVCPFGKE